MDQNWTRTRGIYCKYVIVMWEYPCDLTCEFKHHANVTTCDMLPFFHQPPQPPHNNAADDNHHTAPNVHNEVQWTRLPTNANSSPQTQTTTNGWKGSCGIQVPRRWWWCGNQTTNDDIGRCLLFLFGESWHIRSNLPHWQPGWHITTMQDDNTVYLMYFMLLLITLTLYWIS